MVCIYCGSETRVVNSRPQKRQNNIWRRRECTSCKAVFTTLETPDFLKSLVVRRKKKLEPFLRDKLLMAVHDSLKHRKTSLRDATALTDTIISKLSSNISDATLDDREIALVTHDILFAFDKVAATYYKAYHPVEVK